MLKIAYLCSSDLLEEIEISTIAGVGVPHSIHAYAYMY